jgi:uncharacterized protein
MEKGAVLLDLNAIAVQPGAKGSFTYSLDLSPNEDFTCEGPIEVALEVFNSGTALLVEGTFKGKAYLPCARCLEETLVEVQGKIQEQFSLPGITSPELGLIDQVEPKEAAFADQILNVTELIRQQILINLPLRVLCKASCKGMCPECGQNLNEGKCECPETPGDPAWQALRALKKDRKE